MVRLGDWDFQEEIGVFLFFEYKVNSNRAEHSLNWAFVVVSGGGESHVIMGHI